MRAPSAATRTAASDVRGKGACDDGGETGEEGKDASRPRASWGSSGRAGVGGAMAAKKSARKATPAAKTGRSPSGTKKAAAKKTAPKKSPAKKTAAKKAASRPVEASVGERPDWRDETLARMRRLIQEAVPGVVEEAKWKKPSNPEGVPTWSYEGILCTGETYKDYVKLTFAKGAALPDPARLFNASLEGSTRRAIDVREGDAIDEAAFKSLVRAAAALNAPPGRR